MKPIRGGAIAALVLSASGALASGTGVPLVHVSPPTPDATIPDRLVPGDAAHPGALVATPGGRVTLRFSGASGEAAPYVFVGTRFFCRGRFVVRVSGDGVSIGEGALRSVAARYRGAALPLLGTAPGEFLGDSGTVPETGDLVLRFERGTATAVSVVVEIRAWDAQAGTVLDVVPFAMTYALGYLPSVYPGDLLVPAVARAEGRFGPVRTDVSFVNTSDADVSVAMTFFPADGPGRSNTVPIDVPARTQRRIEDVVRSMFPKGSQTPVEGILAVHGYAAANEGDFVAETYYERPDGGRVGTRLPTYSPFAARASSRLLSFTTRGNPKLVLFSTQPYSEGVLPARTATIRFRREDGGENVETVGLWNGRYGITRVFGVDGRDDLTTLESDDPHLHALLVSTDALTGSTRVLASD